MRKNVLVLAPKSTSEIVRIEKALLAVEVDTLRVSTLQDALYRVGTEAFSSIICVDTPDGSLQRDLVRTLADQPFGAVTPVVVLGEENDPKERSALTSILDQYFPLSTDPAIIAEFCGETHALRSEKAKRGVLGVISVPQVLQQASRMHLTGAIVMEQDDEKCIVYLEEGYVVFASSNRDENRFGEFLVRQGVISKDAFVRSTAILKETGKRFGHILVEEGVIKPQVLGTLIQSQVKHIIYTVFDWTKGEFYILFDEKSTQAEAVAKFEVTSLILEGVRFKFTEERLDRFFSPYDQKVSLALSLKDAQKHIHLGQNEVDFLKMIGEKRPIEDLLHLNSFSRAESLKLLYAFKVLGLLIFEKTGVPKPQKPVVPKGAERAKVIDEMFAPKGKPLIQEPTPLAVASPPEPPPGVSKRSGWVDFLLGAAAISIFVSIITFVDPRALRLGVTKETDVSPLLPSPVATGAMPPNGETLVAKTERTGLDRHFDELVARAEGELKAGDAEKALQTYGEASALKPKNTRVELSVGDILFDLGRIPEARRTFEDVLQADPKESQAYLALGTIYLMQNQRGKAAEALRKYLAQVKRTPQTVNRITEAQKVLQSLEANR